MQTTVLVSGIYTRSKRKHKSYLPDVTHAAIGAEGWENRRVINTPLTSQCLSRVRRAVTELAWQRGGAPGWHAAFGCDASSDEISR